MFILFIIEFFYVFFILVFVGSFLVIFSSLLIFLFLGVFYLEYNYNLKCMLLFVGVWFIVNMIFLMI